MGASQGRFSRTGMPGRAAGMSPASQIEPKEAPEAKPAETPVPAPAEAKKAQPTNDGKTITIPLHEGRVSPNEVFAAVSGVDALKQAPEGVKIYLAGRAAARAEANGGKVEIGDILVDYNQYLVEARKGEEARAAADAQRQQKAAAEQQKPAAEPAKRNEGRASAQQASNNHAQRPTAHRNQVASSKPRALTANEF